MSSKKRAFVPVLIMLLGIMCFTVFLTPAKVDAKIKFIRKQTVEVKSGKSVTLDIKNPAKGYILFTVNGEAAKNIKKGGVRVQLFDAKGKKLQNDYVNLKNAVKKGEPLVLKFYNDNETRLPKGKYKFKFINKTNAKITAALIVYCHTDVTKSMSLKKAVTVKKGGNYVKIGKLDGAFIGIDFSVIGKKNFNFYYDDDGTIYLSGFEKGTSTMQLKLKNGKKYKCKVTVK